MDDRISSILDTIKATAAVAGDFTTNAAKSAGKKAGDTIEVTKLNLKIYDLNAEAGLLLKKLGGTVYAAHRGKDADETEIDAVISELDNIHAEITALKVRIAEFKNMAECPQCGAAHCKNDSFCKQCGAPVK